MFAKPKLLLLIPTIIAGGMVLFALLGVANQASAAVTNNGWLMYGDTTNAGLLKVSAFTNPSTFAAEISVPLGTGDTASNILHLVTKTAPTRAEIMVGKLKVDGQLSVYTCDVSTACDATGEYTLRWHNVGTTAAQDCDSAPTLGTCVQAFDIGYEALSGRAMVVYADNPTTAGKAYYALWNGSAWSPNAAPGTPGVSNEIDYPGTGTVRWIRVIPTGDNLADDRSNRIMVLISDTNNDLFAYYWDGSSFSSVSTIETDLEASNNIARPFDGNWQGATTFILSYGDNDANNDIKYQKYTVGTGWGGELQAYTTAAASTWIQSYADPTSSRILVVTNNAAEDTRSAVWKADNSSDTWTVCNINAGTDCPDTLIEDVTGSQAYGVFERFNGEALHVLNDSASNAAASDRITYTPTSTWSTQSTIGFTQSDDQQNIKAWAAPNSDDIAIAAENVDCDLDAVLWTGAGFSTVKNDQELLVSNTNNSCANGAPVNGMGIGWGYDFAWKMYTPWQRNWRFYADEAGNTPTIPLAAENTAISNIADGTIVRLRINASERGTTAQTDARKKLQYTTGCNPNSALETTCTWTDVDDIGGSGIWHYWNSALQSDGQLLSTTVLTGSTQASTFILDKDNAAGSSMDHNGSAVAELEYNIQSNGAAGSTTYYFRMWDNDQATPVYREQDSNDCGGGAAACTYPSLATAAAALITVGTAGTQTGTVSNSDTNVYIGGMFTFTRDSGSANVTSITITENGTVDASANLANIKLFYDLDTSAPYDCASESYGGSETQYGSTVGAFNAANGTAAFTGSVSVSTTQAMCLYTVLDVGAGAGDTQTIEIQIATASDISVSAGSRVLTGTPLNISGTTTVAVAPTISVAGTATATGTVKVAVGNTIQAQSATISGGTWQINTVAEPSSGAVITVFVDGAADSGESTAVTKYDGTGSITGMILNTNTLTIGSADNQSLTVTNLDSYDCNADEDVMHLVSSTVLNVEGGSSSCAGSVSNSYTDERIRVLASNTLTIGTTETLNTHNTTIDGTLTATGSATLNISGSWDNNSVFTANTSTATFTSTTAETIDSTGATTAPFYNLILNGSGGLWTLNSALTLNNDLTLTAGTLLGNQTVTVNGGDATGNGSVNMSGGTFTIDGAGSLGGNTLWNFSSLVLNGASQTTTATGSGTMTINGTLTIGSTHTLDAGTAKVWNMASSGTPITRTGTLTANTSTFNYTSSSGVTALASAAMTGNNKFYNLAINASSGNPTFTLGVDIEVVNDFNANVGTLGGTHNITANGQVTGGGTVTLTGGTFSHTVATGRFFGSSLNANNWTFNNLAFINSSGAGVTVTTRSTGTGQIIVNGTLTVGSSSGSSLTLNNITNDRIIDVNGSVVVDVTGVLQASDVASFTVGGNWTNSGTFTHGSGTVTFDTASAAHTLNGSLSDDATGRFYNVILNSSSGTLQANAGLIVNNLTLTAGILQGTQAIDAHGDVTGNGVINLTGGTFSHFAPSNTHTFGGNSNWTFYNLTLCEEAECEITASGSGSITVTSVLALHGTVNAGTKTWILSGTGTPLNITVAGGALNTQTSTFRFTGNGATNIDEATYNNLQIYPGGASVTHTLGTETSQTITVNGNLDLGGNTNAASTVITGATYNPTLIAKGNVTLCAATCSNQITYTKSSNGLTLSPAGTKTLTDSNTAKQDLGAVSISAGTSTPIIQLGSSIKTTSLSIASSHSLNVNGANTIELLGSGTPLSNSGTFTYSTGTVSYNGGSATNIAAMNGTAGTNGYYNLKLGDVNDSNAVTYSLAGNTAVNNQLTLSHASATGTDILAGGNFALTLAGSVNPPFNIISGKGQFNKDTSTVVYTGAPAALSSLAMTGVNAFHNLTISSAGTATLGQDIEVAGTLTVNSGTLAGINNVTAAGVVAGAGIISLTGGTFTHGLTGTANFGGSGNWIFNNLTFSGVSGTSSATGVGTMQVNGALTLGASHTLNAAAKTWTLAGTTGTPFSNSGTFNPDTSTVKYTGNNTNVGINNGNTTVTEVIYNNLEVNNSAETYVLQAGLSITGNMSITAGILDTVAGQNHSLNVGGTWTNTGTFTARISSVTFTASSGTITLSGTLNGASAFYDLIFDGSAGTIFQPQAAMLVSNDLAVTAGTLSSAQNITVNGGDVDGDGVVNMTAGTFLLDGTGNFGGNGDWTFNNLTFGDGAETATTTNVGDSNYLVVNGVLTVAANQSLVGGTNSWTLNGSGTPFVTTGSFNGSSTNFVYKGTTNTNIAAGTYNTLELTPASGTPTYTLGTSASQTIQASYLTVGSGDETLTVNWSTNNPNLNLTVGLDLGANVTWTKSNSGILTLSPSGSGALIDNTAVKQDLGAIVFSGGSNSPLIELGSGLKLTSLNIASGHVFDLTDQTLTLTGNGSSVLTNSGTFTAGTDSTVEFVSSATSGTVIPALAYNNLTLNKAANLFTPSAGTLAIGNNLNITAGSLDLNSSDPVTTIAGDLIIGGTLLASDSANLTLNGNWTNNGTFTHNAGTVTMAPTGSTVTIGGTANTAFRNFTSTAAGKTIQFKAGSNPSFAGTLTLTGVGGNPIALQSDAAPTQWDITLSGTAVLSFVSIRDGDCNSSNNIGPFETMFDFGNNSYSCWKFVKRGAGVDNSGGGNAGSGGNAGGGGNGNSGGGGSGSGSGGGCTVATATANVSGNAVVSVTVTAGGSCYTSPPAVAFSGGGGSGATATANLTNGVVTSITVNNGGSNYSSPPTVTIGGASAGGGGTGGGGGGGEAP